MNSFQTPATIPFYKHAYSRRRKANKQSSWGNIVANILSLVLPSKADIPNIVRNRGYLMIPVEEHGSLSETHHEMHYRIVLAKANVWTCAEDKPILWMLFGDAVWTPARRCEFVWIGVDFFVM